MGFESVANDFSCWDGSLGRMITDGLINDRRRDSRSVGGRSASNVRLPIGGEKFPVLVGAENPDVLDRLPRLVEERFVVGLNSEADHVAPNLRGELRAQDLSGPLILTLQFEGDGHIVESLRRSGLAARDLVPVLLRLAGGDSLVVLRAVTAGRDLQGSVAAVILKTHGKQRVLSRHPQRKHQPVSMDRHWQMKREPEEEVRVGVVRKAARLR